MVFTKVINTNENYGFKASIRKYGKRYLNVAVKRKAHTKNQYIKKLKKDNPNIRITTVKKRTKKGYNYGIYARSKR